MWRRREKSSFNSVEAEALVSPLRNCFGARANASDIAVTVGYTAQQTLLQHLVRQLLFALTGRLGSSRILDAIMCSHVLNEA